MVEKWREKGEYGNEETVVDKVETKLVRFRRELRYTPWWESFPVR